ncbi:hypothetical protein [Marinobacterium rhizophilum]|uniref:hypothetical protein n=1 Tax=Marinobacterium rhizophilum TaxID=420402 RepID=UPI00036BFB09|nr:hypothetical protein [Marinobacterium rhizophilum]
MTLFWRAKPWIPDLKGSWDVSCKAMEQGLIADVGFMDMLKSRSLTPQAITRRQRIRPSNHRLALFSTLESTLEVIDAG